MNKIATLLLICATTSSIYSMDLETWKPIIETRNFELAHRTLNKNNTAPAGLIFSPDRAAIVAIAQGKAEMDKIKFTALMNDRARAVLSEDDFFDTVSNAEAKAQTSFAIAHLLASTLAKYNK